MIKQIESTDSDIVKQLYIDSQNFLWAGLLDMALLNAYVALEVCVKKNLIRLPLNQTCIHQCFWKLKISSLWRNT